MGLWALQASQAVAYAFPGAVCSASGSQLGQVTVASTTRKILALFRNGSSNRTARLVSYGFVVEQPGSGDGRVFMQIVGGPGLSGAPNWVSYGGGAVMEYCHTPGIGAQTSDPAPISYTGGGVVKLNYVTEYAKGAVMSGQVTDIGLTAYPGDVFAVIVTNTGGSLVECHFNETHREDA